MIDDPNQFMLDSLRDQQNQLLLLMERANRANVPESALLEWALTDVMTAFCDYRAERIRWMDVARVYQIASNVQHECELAILFPVTDIEELRPRAQAWKAR